MQLPPLKTVIIDDEPLARKRLIRLLGKHPTVFSIVGEAENGKEGLERIFSREPDIIFLDIQMPVMNGFEMLKALNNQPIVVFVTAYDEYAIRAFEENSVDYLLKPVEPERLELTVKKLERLNRKTGEEESLRILSIIDKLKPAKELKSIPVKIGDKILLIKPEEISWFEARDKYVFIHTMDGKEFLTDYTLTVLEKKLPAVFLRIHRAIIINTDHIKEIRKGFKGNHFFYMTDTIFSQVSSGGTYSKSIKDVLKL